MKIVKGTLMLEADTWQELKRKLADLEEERLAEAQVKAMPDVQIVTDK